jgi:hypothetical protein
VWEISAPISGAVQTAIIAHLRDNCDFTFDGPCRLTGEPVPFYGDALLCELVLEPGSRLSSGRKRRQTLQSAATFFFLYKTIAGDEILIPLTGGEGDIVLAKHWLNLDLQSDEDLLQYARFYFAFAQTDRPPQYRNLPRKLSELRFSNPVSEQRMWGIYGALWRFLVNPTTMEIRVHFEPRGSFWRARHRAHLPMQFGTDLFDVDLNVWKVDGHASYRKTSLIYRDASLAEEPRVRPGRIGRPRYISRREWLLAKSQNLRTAIYQSVYLLFFAGFVVASTLALTLPLDLWGFPILKHLLGLLAGATSVDWRPWLGIASIYCIAYFVLTTIFILDIETLRASLSAWSPRFRESRLNELLYSVVVRGRIVENGYRRGLMRRVRAAVTWLIVWTAYLVCVFTSLQASLRPQLADDPKSLADVMQVFAEQAALYIPVVFYYVGRKSLDPSKVALVSDGVLVALQLIMGLLVIRRIHRYWASTTASRLNEQIVHRTQSQA